MSSISDKEITLKLESNDPATAMCAAREIFARGERMIPYLAGIKGNRKPFVGGGLGHPMSSQSMDVATAEVRNYDRVVTDSLSSLLTHQIPFSTNLSIQRI